RIAVPLDQPLEGVGRRERVGLGEQDGGSRGGLDSGRAQARDVDRLGVALDDAHAAESGLLELERGRCDHDELEALARRLGVQVPHDLADRLEAVGREGHAELDRHRSCTEDPESALSSRERVVSGVPSAARAATTALWSSACSERVSAKTSATSAPRTNRHRSKWWIARSKSAPPPSSRRVFHSRFPSRTGLVNAVRTAWT